MLRKSLKYSILLLALIFIAAQFFQPERMNPPVDPAATFEAVAKPGPQLASLLRRSCYDCHSNETVWPWYSRIAPVSWLVSEDVVEGRAHLNFSRWNLLSPDMSGRRLREACQEVQKGEMPLWNYTLMHPAARLAGGDIGVLCVEPVP